MTQFLSEAEEALIAGYVLGDLSPDEIHEFEQLMANKRHLWAEVNAMEASFRLTPQALPIVQPPPHLREQILSAHAASSASNVDAIATPTATSRPSLEPTFETRPSIPWAKIIAGIAALGAILLGADNFRLRQALSVAQNPPDQQGDRVAAILQRPNSRLVALKGEANQAAGTLLFTPGQWQEVVVSLGNLPPLPPEQIYRMWLTLANGQTIACGEFNTNAAGSVFVKLNPPETPPKGVKATGIYVTIDGANSPLNPEGDRVMSGSI